MKLSIIAALILLAAPALAEDKKPPTCGKTVEECQKEVDSLTGKLGQTTLAYQGAVAQRDNIQKAKNDADLGAFVAQQTAVIAAQPKK